MAFLKVSLDVIKMNARDKSAPKVRKDSPVDQYVDFVRPLKAGETFIYVCDDRTKDKKSGELIIVPMSTHKNRFIAAMQRINGTRLDSPLFFDWQSLRKTSEGLEQFGAIVTTVEPVKQVRTKKDKATKAA